MKLIFCAGGNRRFMEIARGYGFFSGTQLPETIYDEYRPLYFADQDWKKPNRAAYMRELAEHRPVMASVLDWERQEQLAEVLDWAEEAAQYCQMVMLIPKVMGGIPQLPRRIGGADVVLGYSVPSRYGGTPLPLWEFAGWPIHLLGGSPQAQMHVYMHLQPLADVVSADGNYASKMATRYCQFWVAGTARANNRYWPRLWEADGSRWGHDAPYEAFRRSCENISAAWQHMISCSIGCRG